jgi:hypothetical protein
MKPLTHKAVVSKLAAAGLKVCQSEQECHGYNGGHWTIRHLWADTPTDRIEWSVTDDKPTLDNALYVIGHGQEDDLMTDYFAGTFCHSIKLALYLATH